jgi:hypothetical protein
MPTTAFQTVIDYAESISINKRGVVSQTTSRDQTVRSTSRGGQVWRFDVKVPDGIPWQTLRGPIEAIENADRYTNANISLNTTGTLDWFMKYQGNVSSVSGWTATATQGSNTLTSLSTPAIASGYRLKAGDLIQLGTTGKVYSVVSDVAFNSNVVTLNRPVIDSSGSKTLVVGPNVIFKVICTNLPNWTIFARDQVSWDGTFTFYEDLT